MHTHSSGQVRLCTLRFTYALPPTLSPPQAKSAPADMFRLTVDPRKAPDTPAALKLTFDKGLPVRVVNTDDGTDISDPLDLFLYLNKIGGAHGVGRVDVVENRFVGIKSRGVYESPGAEILRQGHIGIEGEELVRSLLCVV